MARGRRGGKGRGKGKNGDGNTGGPPGDDPGDDEDDNEEEWDDPNDVWRSFMEPVNRMSKDMRAAAANLGDREARHLVDSYYTMQEDRKRAGGQKRALTASGEPHLIINWLYEQANTLERQLKGALDVYTDSHVMGTWMRDVHGIGPVLSAGLLAHIYMGEWCATCHGRSPEDCQYRQTDKKLKKYFPPHEWVPVFSCDTVGHIWSFAGWAADKQKPWEKGTRRPFNAKFKTLCWKVGQSFMKQSTNAKCVYGHIYVKRKAEEIVKNENLEFADQAAEKVTRVKKTTKAYGFYKVGKLPPGHIDSRARRFAVKQFLADLHGEWYFRKTGKQPPLPYPIAILGHTHDRYPRPANPANPKRKPPEDNKEAAE